MNPQQFKHEIIRPVLEYMGKHSDAAEMLLLGTALVESQLQYVRQFKNGPALGVYQMEPATHRDIWDNYLAFNPGLAGKVRGLASQHYFFWNNDLPHRELIGNLQYATALARLQYLRRPEPLPAADDIVGQSLYWKKYYNTHKGAGDPRKYVDRMQRYLAAR